MALDIAQVALYVTDLGLDLIELGGELGIEAVDFIQCSFLWIYGR